MHQTDSAQPELIAAESTPPEAPTPTVSRLFFGDDGLRAGWCVLIFLLLLVAVQQFATFLIHHFHLIPKPAPNAAQQPGRPKVAILGEGIPLFFIGLIAWIMSLIERRPFTRYGLALKRMPSDFLLGLAWGLFCLSLLVGAMVLTHSLSFDGVLLHGVVAVTYALKWFLGFLLVGVLEEFLFRGYLQYTVARGVAGIVRALAPANRHPFQWGFWVAAFLFSGVFFMLAHLGNPGENFSGIVSVGLAGAVFAFSLYRTGSLWWAIGFHTAWDWAQSFLYGVFDSGTMVQGHLLASHPIGRPLLSGGADGPEASIFCIPTFLLIAAIIHFTLPKRAYPLTPDQTLNAFDPHPQTSYEAHSSRLFSS